jgi:uncharacterized protein YodC (DUF2158 family)
MARTMHVEIEVGDMVRLKSGSEPMTVAVVNEGNAKCFWWSHIEGSGSGGPADVVLVAKP